MIRTLVTACAVLVVMFCLPGSAAAQSTVDEGDYWNMLRLTQSDLNRALNASGQGRSQVIQQINARWQPVTAVRLERGELIAVDTSWLQLPTRADGLTIQTAQDRIAAVRGFQAGEGLSLDGLAGLVDEPEPRPTPAPAEPSQRRSVAPNFSWQLGGLMQSVFIALGVMAVVAALFFIARGLRFTTALAPLKLDAVDDPQTSGDALERASSSERVRDYRAAVRYLYLSSLLKLDESGLIRYDPTLTNREHLVQIQDQPQLGALLAPIIDFFDRSWYGFADITEEDYQRFRQQVDRLLHLSTEQA
jgi:hypothetical protein